APAAEADGVAAGQVVLGEVRGGPADLQGRQRRRRGRRGRAPPRPPGAGPGPGHGGGGGGGGGGVGGGGGAAAQRARPSGPPGGGEVEGRGGVGGVGAGEQGGGGRGVFQLVGQDGGVAVAGRLAEAELGAALDAVGVAGLGAEPDGVPAPPGGRAGRVGPLPVVGLLLGLQPPAQAALDGFGTGGAPGADPAVRGQLPGPAVGQRPG